MKRQNEQKTARERLADIPLSSQDTRKISADQLAEVLAQVDGKRDHQAATNGEEKNEVSGARPVATGLEEDASSERVIQRVQALQPPPPALVSVGAPPSSTQRVTVTGESVATTTLRPATALVPAMPAPKPRLTRLIVLLFILAALLSALYAVVRR